MIKEFKTISDLNNYLKSYVEMNEELRNVTVQGELQGFKKHISGHYFFKLSDPKAQISCMIYSFNDYYNYSKHFKDGDLVEVRGVVNFFNKAGTINLVINSMKLCGDGEKLLKKQELLRKLQENGMIDETKRRNIPKFPKKVGVITSPSGAAIEDIRKNIFNNTKRIELLLFPCIVQGQEAKNSILNAIERSKNYDIDVLIIGRGGGSKEDLSAFDEEDIAYAVHNYPVPVITAVGHEIDKSVIDYVSDCSVSTPTAAALMVAVNDEDILESIASKKHDLTYYFEKKIHQYKDKIKYYSDFSFFKDYKNYFNDLRNKLDTTKNLLENYWKTTRKLLVDKIDAKNELLDELNPLNILNKGYSIVYDEKHNIIDSVDVLNKTNSIYIRMKDGEVNLKGDKQQ